MRLVIAAVTALFLSSTLAHAHEWRPIFNGHDLEGWVPKVNHHPLGENWNDTFRAADGVLRVSYDKYTSFNEAYGHLIYRTPLSSYRLRFEYRFVGTQAPGAPDWALRNSGVMLHGQAPEAIGLDQDFPVSVEAQLLGGSAGETRPTGNVCTPGVTVSINGTTTDEHCSNSNSKTFQDGEWVHFEVEVHGSRLIRHIVNGETVLEYWDVRLAPAELMSSFMQVPALAAKGAVPLDRGYISLQAEGHPIEFRKLELLELHD
jgi:hypothetical protein